MSETSIEDLLRNVDTRLTRVEQYLPTLAAREELQAAIAPLATREELQAAIVPLATRVELESLQREMTILFEDLRDDNRIVIEHLVALSARVDELAQR